jgi:hypothetical protein
VIEIWTWPPCNGHKVHISAIVDPGGKPFRLFELAPILIYLSERSDGS